MIIQKHSETMLNYHLNRKYCKIVILGVAILIFSKWYFFEFDSFMCYNLPLSFCYWIYMIYIVYDWLLYIPKSPSILTCQLLLSSNSSFQIINQPLWFPPPIFLPMYFWLTNAFIRLKIMSKLNLLWNQIL